MKNRGKAHVRIRRLGLSLGVLALLFAGAEIYVRSRGVIDFPLYDADPLIGYIPSANQRGAFMKTNDWEVNEHHMAAGPFAPTPSKIDVLVLGDSIVWGGNPFPMRQKIGAQMEALYGPRYKAWPASAGSWGALNEMEYLNRNEDVTDGCDRLVWIFNGGDFSERSQWKSELTHPKHRPLSAFVYAFRKYVLKENAETGYAVAPGPLDRFAEISAWMAGHGPMLRRLHATFVLYPSKEELREPPTPYRRVETALEGLARKLGVRFFELRRDGDWKEGYYRDGIHPTTEGYHRLVEDLRPFVTADDAPANPVK